MSFQHAHLLPSEHRQVPETQQPAAQDADPKRKHHLNSALIRGNASPGHVPVPSPAGQRKGTQTLGF